MDFNKNEKLYCVEYKASYMKESRKEIFKESQLLDDNRYVGALHFAGEQGFFSVSNGEDYFRTLLDCIATNYSEEQVSEAERLTKADLEYFFNAIPDNLKDMELKDLICVSWPSAAGEKSLVINSGDAKLAILQEVYDLRKDADYLDVREVSREEAELIKNEIKEKDNEERGR